MTVRYLLDTNICIYIARNRPPEVLQRFTGLKPGDVGMSVVTYGELYTGAAKSQQSELALQKLQNIIELIPVLPMSVQTGKYYGEIRATLELAGTPIGNNDLWIAAHARELETTLVSNNLREFERVDGLKLENWVD